MGMYGSPVPQSPVVWPPAAQLHLNDVDQSLTAGSTSVVEWAVAEIDTHGWADLTNFRYTPLQAGLYLATFNASFSSTTLAAGYALIGLRKNGTEVGRNGYKTDGTQFPSATGGITRLIQLNGISDYIDCIAIPPAGSVAPVLQGLVRRTWLSIYWLRY